MGAAALLGRSSFSAQYVKVDVLPQYGVASSHEPEIRVDESAVIIGCPEKLAQDAQDRGVSVLSALADDFEKFRSGHLSTGGDEKTEPRGHPVQRIVLKDKSSSQLLICRGGGEAPLEDAAASAASSSPAPMPFYLVPRFEPFSRISGICKVPHSTAHLTPALLQTHLRIFEGTGAQGSCRSSCLVPTRSTNPAVSPKKHCRSSATANFRARSGTRLLSGTSYAWAASGSW